MRSNGFFRAAGLPAVAAALILLPGNAAAEGQKDGKEGATTMTLLRSLDASSTASWEKQRAALREEWLRILGPFPERADLRARVLRTEHEADHDRLLVVYQTEPGVLTDAYLLLPHNRRERAPAAVVFHATSSQHILQPVGLANASTRHLALHLVRRGYITLSPRCFIYGRADEAVTTAPRTPTRGIADYTSEAQALLTRAPEWSGMGKMLWDGMRAVDYLQSRPEVDPSRIVCVGHSLGAKESLYLAAFDPRIRAGIASEGGVGLRDSNWDAVWYLGSRSPEAAGGRDHHELLALTAPRPFLIAGGGSADGEHTRPLVEAGRPAYALSGKAEDLVLLLHGKGHDFPDETREQAFDWLDQILGVTATQAEASPDQPRK